MADEGPRSAIGAAWRPWTVAAAIGLTAVDALVLHLMGRRLWCSCGSPSPWAWDIWSSHNSQHLIDPYTFTHVLYGAVYYAVLRLDIRRFWTYLPSERTRSRRRGVHSQCQAETLGNPEVIVRQISPRGESVPHLGRGRPR